MKDVMFIAEIGNNHNGSFERAQSLIAAAKDAGCQIAKFQLRNMSELYRGDDRTIEDLGVEYTKQLLYKYELSIESHRKLALFCNDLDIEYMCTPWDLPSVSILEKIGVKRYKIASADFNNRQLIDALIETKKPLILSTGMSTLDEIIENSEYLTQRNVDYTMLHCNSTYPAPFDDIELNFIKTLKRHVRKVGYSGHERGIAVSLAAVALGAEVIERHLTNDRNLEGPDHQASLLPNELRQLITMSREITRSLGETDVVERKLSQGALLNKETLGKSIVAARKIKVGERLQNEYVSIKSPGQGLSPDKINTILGKIVTSEIDVDEFIFPSHFSAIEPSEPGISFKGKKWGVPVRPHDLCKMHDVFHAPVYEFHISYSDLHRPFPDEDWSFLQDREILVHAPELFENSRLLDLCDEKDLELSIVNLNRVCEFCREISVKVNYNRPIPIIANIGGFSTHEFRPVADRPALYSSVEKNLSKIDESGCEITIQNMAPFPWHFGGQRYQNIFVEPMEILKFCTSNNRKITLDTAHLSMFCALTGKNLEEQLAILSPVTRHWHMSDANGTNGEGVIMGTGDVNFGCVLNYVKASQTFIVETWQGHKELGAGFARDLQYLKECSGYED